LTLIDQAIKFQIQLNKRIAMSKFPDDPNGYCPTCKRSQPRVQLCDKCSGMREGAKDISEVDVRPPQINTLYDEEKRQEKIKKQKEKERRQR